MCKQMNQKKKLVMKLVLWEIWSCKLDQYKPEVSAAFLLSKINNTEESADISPEDKATLDKSKEILTSIIEKAYEIEVVEGNQNKKNSIIAFQVQVFEYCLSEI